jgi:uncharacterized protein (TIGR03437 family)
MLRRYILLLVCSSILALAQSNQPVTITSAASASVGLAPESLATATGMNLAMGTARAQSLPWPTTLGGVTIQVTDSASVPRLAGLLFVSPTQINFEIPAGTALGPATVTINNGQQTLSAQVQIQSVAPGLFSVDAQGIAAATAIRIVIPTQTQSPVPVFLCLDSFAGCNLVPIDPGVDAPVYLSFYATGIRGRSSMGNVTVTIGSVTVQPTYAGPQPQFPGLDQVNVPLLLSLRGAGVVNVTVTVDGITSNAVKIQVM